MNRTMIEQLEVLTRASVVELLREMAKTLARLKGCAYLCASQEEHVREAGSHLDQAVAEWINGRLDGTTPSLRRNHSSAPSWTPEHPERGLDCVLNMLEIYHDDLDERDFTSMQLQRITIAAHNLLVVVQEIRKSMH